MNVVKAISQLPLILQLVQLLGTLILQAEALFRGGKRGAEKKAFVKEALGIGLEIAAALRIRELQSEEAQAQVLAAADKAIDATVALYNLRGLFRRADEPAPASP
jgi:hypothetical protein